MDMRKKVIGLVVCMLASIGVCQVAAKGKQDGGRVRLPLSGSEWRMWQDKAAQWKDDRLYLPDEAKDPDKLPVNAPTGGWHVLSGDVGLNVHVPGTVEEYCTVSAQPQPQDNGGVSWWWRTIEVPAGEAGRKVVLHFESVRTRAEVYIDGRLVAYDVVGESPFDADVTHAIKPGMRQQLAVRVTNPGGEFHWQDFNGFRWGKYTMPPGRGFGGIIGRVWIDVVSPVYIEDVYMQNQPKATVVKAILNVRNTGGKSVKRNLELCIREKGKVACGTTSHAIKTYSVSTVLVPGDNTVEVVMEHDGAQLWDLDHPQLYTCDVALKNGKRLEDDAHPPVQIDGNFGVTAGVAEMLLQSQGGYIELLPALPDRWSSGSFKGLCARGSFDVDAQWQNGRITAVTITSKAGKECRINYPGIGAFKIKGAKATVVSDDEILFPTRKGSKVTITTDF